MEILVDDASLQTTVNFVTIWLKLDISKVHLKLGTVYYKNSTWGNINIWSKSLLKTT